MTTIQLSGGPGAVATARHAIEELADQEGLARVDDLRLLVSELVTNSILHGGAGPDDSVRLHVGCHDHDCIRVEVCDDAQWAQQVRSPLLDSDQPPGGWGLMLVSALADRWGVDEGDTTCVWFELAAA